MLITTDSDAPQSNRVAYRQRQRRAGRRRAKRSRRRCRTAAKIALFVGTMDADNARERASIKNRSPAPVELIDTDQVDFANQANMENVLVKCPDIALLSGGHGPADL